MPKRTITIVKPTDISDWSAYDQDGNGVELTEIDRNMLNWRETQKNRLWCLIPLSLACLLGGGLVVFALVKAMLAGI